MRTELHFHLLPDVDDGPANDREALALAELAVADGTQRVLCTPHVRDFRLDELPARVQRLQDVLRAAGVPLQVFAGGELSSRDVPTLSDDELALVAQGPRDARWLLLEVPLWHGDRSFTGAAAQLREKGFGLLIGHPERGSAVSTDQLREHVRKGAILQISASSLAGVHGSAPAQRAAAIVRSGLPFIVASDAHSPARPPLLSDAAARLSALGLDAEEIEAAIDDGPARLFESGLHGGGDTSAVLGLRSPPRQAA